MASTIVRIGVSLLATVTASAASAGPLGVVCIGDVEEEPAQIRVLFERVDRMAVRELFDGHAHFYLADRGFIPIDEFVLRANFRDGREDSAPLAVTAIRRLELGPEDRRRAPYVVRTTRSAWFDRGSDLHSGYTQLNDTWLVTIRNCEINTIREVPELYYLVDDPIDGPS